MELPHTGWTFLMTPCVRAAFDYAQGRLFQTCRNEATWNLGFSPCEVNPSPELKPLSFEDNVSARLRTCPDTNRQTESRPNRVVC